MYNDAVRLIRLIINYGYDAYLVGGCVRDMVMNLVPHDYDITTNAQPNDIIRIVKKAGLRYYDAGIKYGTVNVQIGDNMYEVTTYRGESGYRDSRRPSNVTFINTLDKDLSRRDFTINAMAYDVINNRIIDPFGGMQDIRNGVIRAVGDPNVRFSEDALRILRAMRFSIKLKFSIDKETLYTMNDNAAGLKNISRERVTQELEKILTCGNGIRQVFTVCNRIISMLFPEITPCIGFNQNSYYHIHNVYEHCLYVVDGCKSNKFEIKLAALFHDIGKPKSYFVGKDGYGHFHGHPNVSYDICKEMFKKRLALSKKQYDHVLELIKYHDATVVPDEAVVKRFLNKHSEEVFRDFLVLKQADLDDHINLIGDDKKYCLEMWKVEAVLNKVLSENHAIGIRDLAINGSDIMRITNTPAGKHIGIILNQLLEEVIDNKIVNNRSILENRVREISSLGNR